MSFLRSQLQNEEKVAKLLEKIAFIYSGKPNAFNVDFKGQRFLGEKMSNLELTADPTKVTFTYEGVDYELMLADVLIAKRIRSRKYSFKTNVLNEVVETVEE
jgi:hypothetical protein